MEPKEIVKTVFNRNKYVFAEIRNALLDREKSKARRVGFVKTLSEATRKVPSIPDPFLKIPPATYLPVSSALASSVLCGLENGMYSYLSGDKETLYSEFNMCMNIVERTGGGPVPQFFISNELASTVASSIITKALSDHPLTQTGRVIFVYGSRGSGKTTLVFWSLVSIFVLMGIPMEKAVEAVNTLWVTSIDEYIELYEAAARLAAEGEALPFIVVEDAGALLSKYMVAPGAKREDRQVAYTVSRLEQIAREGVCATIYLAHPESVIKGVRQIADLIVDGRFHDYPPRRHSLWVARSRSGVRDVFATIHPALRIPDDLLRKWLGKKVDTRIKLIEELKEMLKNNKGGGSEGV